MSSSQSYAIGVTLTAIGGIAAVMAGVYVSNSAEPLFALVILAFLVSRISSSKNTPIQPAFVGGLMCLMQLAIGAAVLYLKEPSALWTMFFVGFVANQVIAGYYNSD